MGGQRHVDVACYIGVLRRRLRSTQSRANLLFLFFFCRGEGENIASKGVAVSKWRALSSIGEKLVHSPGRVDGTN
jgi:hypothetical protein